MGQSVMQFAAFECAANFMLAYLAFVFFLSSGLSASDDSILNSLLLSFANLQTFLKILWKRNTKRAEYPTKNNECH